MLECFKSKHDYSAWFSEQIKPKSSHSEVFGHPQNEKKVSYADKFKQNKISPVLEMEKQNNHNSGLSRIQRSFEQISTIFGLSHVFLSSIA
uniref:Uncharacterized protein n=1 Tax=Cucumis melo TaxID=3656 RepID=A0A9I9ECQ4_CUCME